MVTHDVIATSEPAAMPWNTAALFTVERLYRANDPDARESDHERQRQHAATVAAFHAARHHRQTLVYGWLRPQDQGPVHLITTSTGPAGQPVLPTAAEFRPLAADQLTAWTQTLPYWQRIAVITDGLPNLIAPSTTPSGASALDDVLAAWASPYGWLLIATPVNPEAANDAAALASEAELGARAHAGNPKHAVAAERHAARHRELRAGNTSGLWHLHLLAAGTTEAAAYAVAGLLAAGADLAALPYTLVPAGPAAGFATAWNNGIDDTITGAASPQLVSSAAVAAVAAVPQRELPGVAITARHTFGLAVPHEDTALAVGDVLDRAMRPAGRVGFSPQALTRHMFVAGTTGSGKTTTIARLLTELTEVGVPWLVIEPAKSEYPHHLAGVPHIVIRPGDPDATPIGFNPLQPAAGFPLQTHADLIRSLFTAAFAAAEPFPQILDAALTRAYTAAGWDLVLGQPVNPHSSPAWPTLTDLHHHALAVIDAAGYGPEVRANVTGFVNVRVRKLSHGTIGTLFTAAHQLDIGKLLAHNVIVAIEDVGDETDQAFLMGALLITLTEHLRIRHRTSPVAGLRHVTVVEEAHRLLSRPHGDGAAAHAVNTFASLLAEVRALGEGIIIADQVPSKLLSEAIKITDTKIVHRLPAQDDRDAVGATMNLTRGQSEFLVSVKAGTAAIFTADMDRPVLSKITALPTSGNAATPVPAIKLTSDLPLGCGPECVVRPCTLREHRAAQLFLEQHPAIRVWVDLTVAAHVLAVPAPGPGPKLQQLLGTTVPQFAAHALGHAVAESVHTRASATSRTHRQDDFARHMFSEVIRRKSPGESGCTDAPNIWWHSAFRCNPIRVALLELIHRTPKAGRHPDSARWEAELGGPIPGDSAAEQEHAITGWANSLAAEQTQLQGLIFGTPPTLEGVLQTPVHSRQWAGTLRRTSATLEMDHDWLATYMLQPYEPATP